jgi:hypothetical protein
MNFKKSTNQKQELSVAAMFLTDQDEMSDLYKGPSKVFKLQFIWLRGFRGRRTPSDGKSSYCLWQGELKIITS